MLNRIEKVLKEKLHWIPKTNTAKEYSNSNYDSEICYLRLNDFPDEVMWTLFFYDYELDLEEVPENWTFTYRSDIDEIIEKVSPINVSIHDFLMNHVHWEQIPEMDSHYRIENVNSDHCFLTMNIYRSENSWTLYYFGEILNLKEIPDNWSIKMD